MSVSLFGRACCGRQERERWSPLSANLGLAWGSLMDIFTNPEKFSGGEHFSATPVNHPHSQLAKLRLIVSASHPTGRPPASAPPGGSLQRCCRFRCYCQDSRYESSDQPGKQRRDEIRTRGAVFILQLRLPQTLACHINVLELSYGFFGKF